MVSRTFLAGALAVLSSSSVIAGPCRLLSSSTVGISYSSAATDSTSATVVSSTTESLSTETLSIETLSTETLETSLTVSTTDVTTSTVIAEATTTTAEGLTTTELTTSDATSYQTTETTVTKSGTTTASETTTTGLETTTTAAGTTTTAAYAVPTAFKLISDGGDSDGMALAAADISARSVFFGDVPDSDVQHAILSYDEQTGQLSFGSQTLCVYRDDYGWVVQVRTCATDFEERSIPLLCEKPTSDELKCRMPGSECSVSPSESDVYCGPNNLEWSQFFVRHFTGSSYIVYFGIDDASVEELNSLQLAPISLQILGV